MFGGRSFMVHGQFAVCDTPRRIVPSDAAPEEVDILVHRDGARQVRCRHADESVAAPSRTSMRSTTMPISASESTLPWPTPSSGRNASRRQATRW